MSKNVTYRLEETVTGQIDAMAEAFSIPKTDVLRAAIGTLWDMLRVAQADAYAVLEVIRDRHTGAEELTIDVTQGDDGNPNAMVRIDGTEYADVGASVRVVGDIAYVFLTIPDGDARVLFDVGSEHVLVRPQFPVRELPWPPQNLRIVLNLKEPAPPAVSDAVLALETA